MLYSTTSPDRSGCVTFVVRPSTISLRPVTASLRYATLMTRSFPSTEDLLRSRRCDKPFPIWHVLLRFVTSTHDCHHVLTTASLEFYDEPRVTTFTLRAHTFNEKHTFCHVLFKRFKMNVSASHMLPGVGRITQFAQIVAERVTRTCRCDSGYIYISIHTFHNLLEHVFLAQIPLLKLNHLPHYPPRQEGDKGLASRTTCPIGLSAQSIPSDVMSSQILRKLKRD